MKKIAADLHAQPGVSIPRASGDWAGAKADAIRHRKSAKRREGFMRGLFVEDSARARLWLT